MPALTRRKDPHHPDRWDVYFGDIAVGTIGRCAGVPLHVDQWEWGCGLSTVSRRGVSASGTAANFDDASGPNLTFRFAWGFPEQLACASLGHAQANEYPVEPSRPQQA
jgi:hypothetical protein